MRWTLLDRVRKTHPKLPVENTYGYLTKHKRIALGLPKTHCADAFCIAGNLKALEEEISSSNNRRESTTDRYTGVRFSRVECGSSTRRHSLSKAFAYSTR